MPEGACFGALHVPRGRTPDSLGDLDGQPSSSARRSECFSAFAGWQKATISEQIRDQEQWCVTT
jgi:hypothetical protein